MIDVGLTRERRATVVVVSTVTNDGAEVGCMMPTVVLCVVRAKERTRG